MKWRNNDESYRVNVRGAEIEQQKAMVAIVVSLFMYIAFILISAVGTILAVQSLSDSTKYKYRYLTLRRLGIMISRYLRQSENNY